MKTIIVIFTNVKLSVNQMQKLKRYAFVTNSDIKEGDLIVSKQYENSKMQVVKVLDAEYKFYNDITGDMSNDYTSTKQREIKELVIREENESVVYGRIEQA